MRAEATGVDHVVGVKVRREILQMRGDLHNIVERGAARGEDALEVVEDLFGLRRDIAADDLIVIVKRRLASRIERLSHANTWRVRGGWRRSAFGVEQLLLHEHSS